MEYKLFNRKIPDFDCLLKKGFKKENDHYVLLNELPDSRYLAEITIANSGEVRGKIMEAENRLADDPDSPAGHNARLEYEDLLHKIAEECFEPTPFIGAQANRIVNAIKTKYSIQPDFPWKKFPDYAVFRHHGSRKWYALLMNIEPAKLYARDLADKPRIPANILQKPEIEIMDLKIPPMQIPTLVAESGIFPGYHMDAHYWISILLEDILPDSRILALVGESYEATMDHKKHG